MYPRNISFDKRFSRAASSLSSNTSVGLFRYTKEDLISKLASVLQSCSHPNPEVIKQGQQVHAQLIINEIDHAGLLGSRLLGMYILCGKYIDARSMFHKLDLFYASPWNWMIRGFTMMGCFDSAISVYFKMLGCGTCPDKYTFPYVIKACGQLRAVGLAKSVHRTIRMMGFEMDVYVGSSLIKLYAENGCIGDARRLFDKIPQRDDVLWNVILNGYLKHGDSKHVLLLFNQMRSSKTRPGSVTYACVLSACASDAKIKLGTQIHSLLIKCGQVADPQVLNTLIAVYAKCKWLVDARELFDSIQEPDSVTWNVIIGGHVQNGLMNEALDLLREMILFGTEPDTVTLASFLPSLSESASVNQGKEIHCYILRQNVHLDVFLKNALIDMYFKCQEVEMAQNVFTFNTDIDIVICTAMISGYVLNGMNFNALEIFRFLLDKKMKPNAVTLSSSLPACAGLADIKLGKELHGQILKNGLERLCHVGTAVIDMYAKCGRLDLAHQMFVKMPERDSVCWNSMITSFCQNGQPEKAVDLFHEMGSEGAVYDSVSISSVLSACANMPSLGFGKAIHAFMTRGALKADLYAESALIDMYAKCGNLEYARSVFNTMQVKNEVSWNSIISAYGNHGHLQECLLLFHQMKEFGFQPDHVTFLAIISACDHTGLVDDGYHYFKSMTNEYGIEPRTEHYACIIDLFGRAGRLNEACEIIKSMPFDPDAGVWGTLLGAARVYGNVELAETACSRLFEMDPTNSGYYVLLSNVQADAGKWEGVNKTRNMMKVRGVEKVPGYSWIEVNNETHVFGAADKCNPRSGEIYSLLKSFGLVVRDEGYVTVEKEYDRVLLT
ncbi:pentatricopeptide repeat-containing protein At4g21300-like [Bidens hawaiensis]|uniref:pentatricopeptide repeat-containing protein At4g21300-like n=1 Tax=Bidens hawaiensis TaxID=980011 RepID=UPI00404A97FF